MISIIIDQCSIKIKNCRCKTHLFLVKFLNKLAYQLILKINNFAPVLSIIMKKYIFSILILAFLAVPSITWAWGQQGHRIVGEIAFRHLSPKAKAAIQKILGVESMALASTWADFIRSDTGYKYLDSWHYIDFDQDLTYSEMKKFLKSDTAHDAYTA